MRIVACFMMVAVVMLAGCGGGMNASNSDAPKANEAHEATWVTYHRNALFKFDVKKNPEVFASYSSGRALINENVLQCNVCHDPALEELRKGPECISCHVLDPLIYPFNCYSCHGIGPVVPFGTWLDQYTSARRGRPINQNFIANVRKGVYHHRVVSPAINHDAVPLPSRDPQVCRQCHDNPSGERTLAERHHALMDSGEPWVETDGCFYCHTFSFVIGPDGIPIFDFTADRNCSSCHN